MAKDQVNKTIVRNADPQALLSRMQSVVSPGLGAVWGKPHAFHKALLFPLKANPPRALPGRCRQVGNSQVYRQVL